MKKLLYLMRHGQTVLNEQNRIQGWFDSPLTALGVQQAENAKKYFDRHAIKFDHAYSSTSERASDTLEIITDMPYRRLKALKEKNYGLLEGESNHIKKDELEEVMHIYFNSESSKNIKQRMNTVLTKIMEKPDHYSVLAVSHGMSCWEFIIDLQNPNQVNTSGLANACIIILAYENGEFILQDIIDPNKGK